MSNDPLATAVPAPELSLGIPDMDRTHHEFLDLCARTRQADAATFAAHLRALRDHTLVHFANEEALMRESAFPATAEHSSEHQRVLGELDRFLARAEAGSQALARAWLVDQVPEWFRSHLLSMDSALAAHLKGTGAAQYVHLRV